MSEIKQINTGVAELLAVKVPEGASDLTLPKLGMADIYFDLKNGEYQSIGIPPGDWTPLGIDTELTEEQCMELVTKGWNIAFGILYKGAVRYHVTAQKAFASLMQANGINEPHLILKRLS